MWYLFEVFKPMSFMFRLVPKTPVLLKFAGDKTGKMSGSSISEVGVLVDGMTSNLDSEWKGGKTSRN